jgi:Flp pilus assembly protein CpaB
MRRASLVVVMMAVALVAGLLSLFFVGLYLLQPVLDLLQAPAVPQSQAAHWLIGVPWILVGYAIYRAGSRLPGRPSRVR